MSHKKRIVGLIIAAVVIVIITVSALMFYIGSKIPFDSALTYIIASAEDKGTNVEVDVWVDGKLMQRNVRGDRIRYIHLKPGKHTIQVTAPGYEPSTDTLDIDADDSEAYGYFEMRKSK